MDQKYSKNVYIENDLKKFKSECENPHWTRMKICLKWTENVSNMDQKCIQIRLKMYSN